MDSNASPYIPITRTAVNRRDNITDWSLDHFRTRYRDETITKW